MTRDDDALTTLLKTELSSVNRGIIKTRKSLADLIKNPVFEEGDNTIELDKTMLEEVAEKLSSPSKEVLFPLTIYLPSGTDEGYITGRERPGRRMNWVPMAFQEVVNTGCRNTGPNV